MWLEIRENTEDQVRRCFGWLTVLASAFVDFLVAILRDAQAVVCNHASILTALVACP